MPVPGQWDLYIRVPVHGASAEPDDTYLFDFALLFSSVLLDFYEETKMKKRCRIFIPRQSARLRSDFPI